MLLEHILLRSTEIDSKNMQLEFVFLFLKEKKKDKAIVRKFKENFIMTD